MLINEWKTLEDSTSSDTLQIWLYHDEDEEPPKYGEEMPEVMILPTGELDSEGLLKTFVLVDGKPLNGVGTYNYDDLINKPTIEGYKLQGNLTAEQAGLQKKLPDPVGDTFLHADSSLNLEWITNPAGDYDALSNKPLINGMELTGNKTASELGLADKTVLDNEITRATNEEIRLKFLIDSEANRATYEESLLWDDIVLKQDVLPNITPQTSAKLGTITFDSQGHIRSFIEKEIVNNVTSTDTDKPLSAYQGKLLRDMIAASGNIEVVSTKPSSPVANTLYYVGTTSPYQIWFYGGSTPQWYDMGTTTISLSGYATVADMNSADTALGTRIDSLTTTVSGKQDTLTAGSNIAITSGVISATDTTYTAGDGIAISSTNIISSSVKDVTVGGSSVVASNVAVIPAATSSAAGVVKVDEQYGVKLHTDNYTLQINKATNDEITARTNTYKAIVPNNIDFAVKAALCDGKGAAYSTSEKSAARTRIGVTYETTAPTSAISDGGVHIVVLNAQPAAKYDGYIYFITE